MKAKLFNLFIILITLVITSCTTTKKLTKQEKDISLSIDTSSVLLHGFSGLYISDLNTNQVLFSRNAHKYFVPASNTKLFTLEACLSSLGDSIPALKYVETDSTFTFWGSGDPTFLNPVFPESGTLEFLKSKSAGKKIYQSYAHSGITPYGEGWMWDDYNDYYQPELTSFPMYGNLLLVKKDSTGLTGIPENLMARAVKSNSVKFVTRNPDYNLFQLPELIDTIAAFEQEIPYKNAESVNHEILEGLLNTTIYITNQPIPVDAKTFYSLPVDTVYRRMMQISDNMLAEHLLLVSGMAMSDTISSSFSIKQTMNKSMGNFSQKPKWVDGSGLSRYNMMTPQSITELLKSMYGTYSEERLFSILSAGGVNGTIQGLYKSINKPYIFAKSGTLSGAYNLSGFLIAKSGRKLIFSFMNNNFNIPTSRIRKEVERVLNMVREMY